MKSSTSSLTNNFADMSAKKLTSFITEKEIVWKNVMILIYMHAATVYGTFLVFTGQCMLKTFLWTWVLMLTSTLGVTGGAHRLWAHRSYKANLPVRIFLCALMTMTFQNSIYEWVRDHRVHHKFSETDADPHNAKRGFFFSHMGWLMVRKHRDVIEKGKTIDLSDLTQDGVVMFQKKYYGPLVLFGTFMFPGLVPWYFWNETTEACWYVAVMFKYVVSVNLVWCINSAAHIFGPKPYDKNIGPTQNPMMLLLGMGEGFHNYHHAFPWDYKAAEFGSDIRNVTTEMITLFAKMGWVTDLKTASPDMIRKKATKHGDGTWNDIMEIKRNFVEDVDHVKEPVWGWGDKCMSKQELKDVNIINVMS